MSEEGYTLIVKDVNDPIIFTAFPNCAEENKKFYQMGQDKEPGFKMCYAVNLETNRVVWMGSSDKIKLPNGRCIKDRCTIKIEHVIYVDSYELLNHGTPSNVTFAIPPHLEGEIDDLAEYFNIMHAASAERLYDTFIYEFRKMDKAGREGKLSLRYDLRNAKKQNEKAE